MPVSKRAQRCIACEGKPWACCPQLVVDEADAAELARRCDADESAAWREHDQARDEKRAATEARAKLADDERNRLRRKIEEQIAALMADGLPTRELPAERRIAELRAEMAKL